MYPPPPFQAQSAPGAPGPAGLDDAVHAMFNPPDPNAPPPDPYAMLDDKMLLQRFKDFKDEAASVRPIFERQWWMILLYVLGRQWIYYDMKRNEWRDKRLKKWIPKPVTNKMKEVQAAIRAMFSSVQMGTVSRPNGNDSKNAATAATVDGLQPLIHDEHKMEVQLDLADFWLVNLGNVFLHPWWDKDGGPVKPVFDNVDPMTGQPVGAPPDPTRQAGPGNPKVAPDPTSDPTTGQPATTPNPRTDPFGDMQTSLPVTTPAPSNPQAALQPVGVMPVGQGRTDVVSPFEILLPATATMFDECARLVRVRWREKHYYETNHPDLVSRLTFEHSPHERSMTLFKALASQNSLAMTPFGGGGMAGQQGKALGLTEYEYWEKPSKQFPEGLFFRVLGENSEIILHDEEQSTPGPLPYTTVKGEVLWPWVHIPYEQFGGKLWADGAIDPLIPKQDQINRLDSLVELGVQRMSNPIWLEPKGAEVERFTGEPGLVVKYTTIGATGLGKPERLDSTGPHPSLFQLRQQHLQDIEEMAGTYDVLKGQKPSGVEAFSALQLLVERSQSRFTRAFKARGEGYRQWYAIAIELERKYGPTERTWALMGPNNTWTFNTFQQADLMGDVNIVSEDGTNVPKTSLGKRAAMEQARNMGFVNPQDPDQAHAFLSEMGLQNLMPGLDGAKKNALRQQDAFEKWAMQDPQLLATTQAPLKIQPWDNPQILLGELQKWANADHMQALMNDATPIPGMAAPLQPGQMPPAGGMPPTLTRGQVVEQILVQYYQQLAMMIQQAAMQAAAAQPQPGGPGHNPNGDHTPPGAGHAPGHGQAMQNSNRNSTSPAIANHGQPAAPVPAAG